jgi:G3E family GTPase
LRDPALADTAVLINEFGEIGIDHHLLERIDETMVVLQSGCLCCTIRGELATAIKDLHGKRERAEIPAFRRLVIESTGLADPFPILSTVQAETVLRHHFRLGNVITTVDAVNGVQQFDAHTESVKQIAVADRLVLTKTDLVPAETAARVAQRIGAINPSALLRFSPAIDANELLGDTAAEERWFPAAPDDAHHLHADRSRHGDDIRAVALSWERPVDWAMFGVWLTMLLHRHGNELLRIKGILNVAGSETPVAVHGVQHLIHPPAHLAAWPDAGRHSRLVLIVKGLEPTAIARSLHSFL